MSRYKSVSIFNRENDVLVGMINFEDGSLRFTVYGHENMSEYLNAHKEKWENTIFKLKIGGKDDDKMWHGFKDVTKDDPDFLAAIWQELFDNARQNVFDMKYYFTLNS